MTERSSTRTTLISAGKKLNVNLSLVRQRIESLRQNWTDYSVWIAAHYVRNALQDEQAPSRGGSTIVESRVNCERRRTTQKVHLVAEIMSYKVLIFTPKNEKAHTVNMRNLNEDIFYYSNSAELQIP